MDIKSWLVGRFQLRVNASMARPSIPESNGHTSFLWICSASFIHQLLSCELQEGRVGGVVRCDSEFQPTLRHLFFWVLTSCFCIGRVSMQAHQLQAKKLNSIELIFHDLSIFLMHLDAFKQTSSLSILPCEAGLARRIPSGIKDDPSPEPNDVL